jgi:hypothetical protein
MLRGVGFISWILHDGAALSWLSKLLSRDGERGCAADSGVAFAFVFFALILCALILCELIVFVPIFFALTAPAFIFWAARPPTIRRPPED